MFWRVRAVRSLLHPDDLARRVAQEYAVATPVTVALLRLGFNDTYVVTDAAGERLALRVYLREKYWIRSESDLLCELELLEHLADTGRAVARPRRRCGGELLGQVTAPEGARSYALFSFAPGRPADQKPIAPEMRHALGAEIARLHGAMDEFRSEHSRYHLDADLLVGMALSGLQALGVDKTNPSDYAELEALTLRVRDYLSALDLEPAAYGLIHADIHLGNVLVGATGEFVFIDFDHSGFGWRVYDLTNFYEGPDRRDETQQKWTTLLAGYESVRPLTSSERDAIPVLAACRGSVGRGRLDPRGQLARCRLAIPRRCASRSSTGSVNHWPP